MSEYELQMDVKRRMKLMLQSEEKVCLSSNKFSRPITLADSLSRSQIPRELIFLVRAQRMLQVENQILGSPSNRVNITAKVRLPLLLCPGPHSLETDPRLISSAHSGLLEDTLSPNHRPVAQSSPSAFALGSRSNARF